MIGQTFTHYRVVERLGGGGMGVVYRADDLRLDRAVALKFLPDQVADDAMALERFRREAKAASALNHPGICTIHDIDEANGRLFIVMELMQGQTLKYTIAQGPLTPPAVVELGIQIADALEAAHAKGIVHRDVKPANIFVTADGRAKLLDFGLAKLNRDGAGAPHLDSNSPTNTLPEELTSPGTAMGTIGYMSPEQALGREADRRTDLFSLGVVLYEMTTGKSPFPGSTAAAVFDGILHATPAAPSRVSPGSSPELDRVIGKALEKTLDARYQRAAELREDLARLRSSPSGLVAQPPRAPGRRVMAALIVAALLLAGVAAFFTLGKDRGAGVGIATSPLTSYPGAEALPSFSPDGKQVAFAWNGDLEDNWDIYVKLIGTEPPLRLTSDAAMESAPAWSPNGQEIAFVRHRDGRAAVHVVSPLGGADRKLFDFQPVPGLFGWMQPSVVWTPDGARIALAELGPEGASSVVLVSVASGIRTKVVSEPLSRGHLHWPAVSPNGRAVAYANCEGERSCDVCVHELTASLEPTGQPRRLTEQGLLVEGLAFTRDGSAVVYSGGFRLWRVSVTGGSPPTAMEMGDTAARTGTGGSIYPAVAAPHRRLAFSETKQDPDVWKLERGGVPRRFISSTRQEMDPQFSPDGRRIAFTSDRSAGALELWTADRDGSNLARLTSAAGPSRAGLGSPRWSPDGRFIAYDHQDTDGHWDIHVIEAAGGQPRRVTPEASDENLPSWSRDGRFLYFGSNRTGRYEIWRAGPDGSEAQQVTRDGGFAAAESWDGQTLYYTKAVRFAGPLYGRPAAGGPESEVLPEVYLWSFVPVEGGVYYCVRSGGASLSALDLRWSNLAGKDELVTRFEAQTVQSLTVSPDHKQFLFTAAARRDDDLVLVDGFE